MPDSKAVNSMFARIAGRYDLANHLLSGGLDFGWRQRLVRAVHDVRPGAVLDLATGSGDVAFALADNLPTPVTITGMDFCQPMLDEAISKQIANPRWQKIAFKVGDGLALPLQDHSVDAITIAFGLRNMADRHRALTEMRRVLRPSGSLFVLEFSQPAAWFRPFYFPYLKYVLPKMASLVTGDRAAYDYLGGSIEEFPDRAALSGEIARAGFRHVQATSLTFGTVALHEAIA
jgi:demethylmenaquinone methyltransferase/2-methoxy-6-polyprenyl-1,4-benzoquinol methylase